MNPRLRTLLATLGLAAFGAAGGCVGGYVDAGPTPVYGEFGYVGGWGYDGPAYDEGGIYVHPPFNRGGRDDHRGAAPGRSAPAPSRPSIPSAPRPSAPASHSGGGARSSGGGGSHGGGGGDHRRP